MIIGLDLGTSSCKALALDNQGVVQATTGQSYHLQTSQPGWAEEDAELVWQSAARALVQLTEKVPVSSVAGISLSGAMHSLLPVGADNQPLAPAMTWADLRSAAALPSLRSRTDPHAVYLRTGCPLQALYHPAKLRWWLEQKPEVARKAARFVNIKDYVLFNLSGVWAIDLGLASSTGLLDTHNFHWDAEVLALAGISADQLPEIVSPFQVVGRLTNEAARQTGLPAGLPVVAGTNDGGAANVGTGAHLPGQNVITVGTSGAIRCLVSQPYLDEQERTWCYLLFEGRWFAGGAINNGGLAVQWVREKFYSDLPGPAGFAQLFQDAATVPAGADGLLFLPYFTGERNPHWDTSVRAMILGLGLEHGRAHITRAVLEGVAFCLADVWAALDDLKSEDKPILLTGGITQSPVWAQIVSDVLNVRLAAVENGDASATGAAILGHYALGSASSLDSMTDRIQPVAFWSPDLARHALYQSILENFRAQYRTQKSLS